MDLGPVLQVAPLLVLGLYRLRVPPGPGPLLGLGSGSPWGGVGAVGALSSSSCLVHLLYICNFLGGAPFPGGVGVPCLRLRLNVSHIAPWCELAGRKNDPQTC